MRQRIAKAGSARAATVALSALMLAAGGTSYLFFGDDKPKERSFAEAERATVKRGDLRITLKRTGTFEAQEARNIRSEIRGSARIVSVVDEGTLVKEGDVLVELDKTEVQKDVENRQMALEKAEESLKAAEVDRVITEMECASRTQTLQINAQMARLEVEKFEKGSRPKELRDADLKIDRADATLSKAKEVFGRMPELLKEGFVTQEEYKQSELEVKAAQTALETAKLERKILVDYTHKMHLERLRATLAEATAELQRYEKVSDRKVKHRELQVRQRQMELERACERLRSGEEWLANMTIRAPGGGIVVYGGGYRWGWLKQREDIRVGGTVWRHQVIMRLPDLNTLQLAVNIHEADVNKVRVTKKDPQRALITVDSIPGKTFGGFLKKIATLADSERGREHVKLFSTTIGLDEQIEGIRPGMTANVEVFVRDLSDVLYVPVQAVHTRQAKIFCYVPTSAGRHEKRPVGIGASNNSFIEINSGLSEGEEVLIVKPEVESSEAPDEKAALPGAPRRRRR